VRGPIVILGRPGSVARQDLCRAISMRANASVEAAELALWTVTCYLDYPRAIIEAVSEGCFPTRVLAAMLDEEPKPRSHFATAPAYYVAVVRKTPFLARNFPDSAHVATFTIGPNRVVK
jgi:hypothetical protein